MVKSLSFKTSDTGKVFRKASIACTNSSLILSHFEYNWTNKKPKKLFREIYLFKDNIDSWLVAKYFLKNINGITASVTEILFIKNIIDWMIYGE